jgi:PUA-domain protein
LIPLTRIMPKIEKIKKRHLLKKREQKAELERIASVLGTEVKEIDQKTQFEAGVLDDGSRVLLDRGEILFFESEGMLFPTLHALLKGMITIPRVSVDMGAVRFVVNGADIMRPGVTGVDDGIKEGSVVAIVDERHGKPLAVGIALLSTAELRAADSGKVVRSVHHVNDQLWDFTKG